MTEIEPAWGAETALYAATNVADDASPTTRAVTNKLCTGVRCKFVYGANAEAGIKVYLLRCYDDDLGTYEDAAAHNFVGEADRSVLGTHYFVFSVPVDVYKFKVYMLNESGSIVNCTVQYGQLTHYEVVA
jgi:hypothetical protein